MSIAWIVSEISANDLPAVNLIEQQSLSPWTPDQLEGELAGAPGIRLVCRHPDTGILNGFVLGRTVGDEAEILKIATNLPDQRQGIATCLLREFIRQLRATGTRKCYLELRSANTRARRIYEKLDFLVTGLRKNYYTDPEDDAICMTLSISGIQQPHA